MTKGLVHERKLQLTDALRQMARLLENTSLVIESTSPLTYETGDLIVKVQVIEKPKN